MRFESQFGASLKQATTTQIGFIRPIQLDTGRTIRPVPKEDCTKVASAVDDADSDVRLTGGGNE